MEAVRSKYGAKRTEVDGILFASQREARRYSELRILERAGEIRDLELQPVYPITANGRTVAKYVADFRYQTNGGTVIEDVKGMKTPVYRLKKKLVEAIHGVRITET